MQVQEKKRKQASAPVEEGPSPLVAEPEPSMSHLSDPSLSPRAIRATPIETSPRGQETTAKETTEAGAQCSLLVGVPFTGIERQCRHCGGLFEADSRHRQKLWIGCDNKTCAYWLHADCLLGKSTKITPAFVKKLPFLCPSHK